MRQINSREVDRIYEWAQNAYLKARLAKRHTRDEQDFEVNAPVLLADLAEDIWHIHLFVFSRKQILEIHDW